MFAAVPEITCDCVLSHTVDFFEHRHRPPLCLCAVGVAAARERAPRSGERRAAERALHGALTQPES